MKSDFGQIDNFRYERKFFISDLSIYEVEALIKLHPAMFKSLYPPRYVNNIYFDSLSAKNYFDNIDGNQNRIKIRIRWYGNLFGPIEKPVLELKTKKGVVGNKKSYPLKEFILNNQFHIDTLNKIILQSGLPPALHEYLSSMKVILLNRYYRKYYQSNDKKCRITIDNNLEYYHISEYNNSYLDRYIDIINTIVELKYAVDDGDNMHVLSNYFPFRLTKNSKYVTGLEYLYAW